MKEPKIHQSNDNESLNQVSQSITNLQEKLQELLIASKSRKIMMDSVKKTTEGIMNSLL